MLHVIFCNESLSCFYRFHFSGLGLHKTPQQLFFSNAHPLSCPSKRWSRANQFSVTICDNHWISSFRAVVLSAVSLMAFSHSLDTFARALSSFATPKRGRKAVPDRWNLVPHSIGGL